MGLRGFRRSRVSQKESGVVNGVKLVQQSQESEIVRSSHVVKGVREENQGELRVFSGINENQ
jgi:hypothetical protein